MLSYVLLEIKRKPIRALGSVLGFAFGVCIFSLCSVLVYNNNDRLWNVLSSTGTHFIAYKPVCCEVPYINDRDNQGFFVNGTPSNPFSRKLEASVAHLKSVKDAAAAIQFRIKFKNSYLNLFGVPLSDLKSIENNSCGASDIIAGRYFTDKDKRSVVLDSDFAKINNYRPGLLLELPNGRYEVIGVMHTGVKPVKADVFMPYKVAEEAIGHYAKFSLAGLANIILVESKSSLVHQTALKEVQRILGSNGITSSYACHKPSSRAISINSNTMSVLIAINIFFLMLYTFRTLLTSINERRKDFGILYSLGWSRARLIKLIVLEGCVQTVSGSIIGLIVCVIIVPLLPSSAGIFQDISLTEIPVTAIVLRTFVITLVAGVIAGATPGLTFLRKTPAQMIRGR